MVFKMIFQVPDKHLDKHRSWDTAITPTLQTYPYEKGAISSRFLLVSTLVL